MEGQTTEMPQMPGGLEEAKVPVENLQSGEEKPKSKRQSKKKDGEVPSQASNQSLDPLVASKEAEETEVKEEEVTPPKQKFKFKAKVDGVEEEVEIDEDEMRRHYQLSKASGKRFQESAALRKENEEIKAAIKDRAKLADILRANGIDPYDLAEEVVAEKIKFNLMTPEQRKIAELEWTNKQLTETRKREEDERLNAENQKEKERLTKDYQAQIIEALKSTNIPKTASSVARMASIVKDYWQRGVEISFKEAADLLSQERKSYFAELSKDADLKLLKDIIGQSKVDALVKDSLAVIKDPIPRVDRPRQEEQVTSKGKHYLTEDDLDKHLKKFKVAR